MPEIKRTTHKIKFKDNSGSFKITPIYYKVDKKNDRLIEVKSLLECDFIMVEKEEMENAVQTKNDWKLERLEALLFLERFCKIVIEKEYPDENWIKWDFKQSYKGNWNIWRNKKLLSSLKNDPRYKKESRNNQQNYNENYNDDYVPIHEEFDRDELDPDLRESWDESFNRHG